MRISTSMDGTTKPVLDGRKVEKPIPCGRFSRDWCSGLAAIRCLIDKVTKSSDSRLIIGISSVMKLDIDSARNYIGMGRRHHFVLALQKKG